MTRKRDHDSGQFTEQYPQQAFLEAIDDIEMATTKQVADAVGCSYDLAYRRLNHLADTEAVTRRKVGGAYIWSRS